MVWGDEGGAFLGLAICVWSAAIWREAAGIT